MQFNISRSVDPDRIQLSVTVEPEDLDKAFVEQGDPDEDLFYSLFQPRVGFDALPLSVRIGLVQRVVQLVEQFEAGASNFNPTEGSETPV